MIGLAICLRISLVCGSGIWRTSSTFCTCGTSATVSCDGVPGPQRSSRSPSAQFGKLLTASWYSTLGTCLSQASPTPAQTAQPQQVSTTQRADTIAQSVGSEWTWFKIQDQREACNFCRTPSTKCQKFHGDMMGSVINEIDDTQVPHEDGCYKQNRDKEPCRESRPAGSALPSLIFVRVRVGWWIGGLVAEPPRKDVVGTLWAASPWMHACGLFRGLDQVHAHRGCMLQRLGVALCAALVQSENDFVSEETQAQKEVLIAVVQKVEVPQVLQQCVATLDEARDRKNAELVLCLPQLLHVLVLSFVVAQLHGWPRRSFHAMVPLHLS